MLFMQYARLRPDLAPLTDVQTREMSEHLAQPVLRTHMGGWTTDAAGSRTAFFLVFEAPDRAAAEAFVHDAPLARSGALADVFLDECRLEVGSE